MSSTDPIFYPISRGSRDGLRQDIIRTRTDLVGTLEELAGRIDIADRARAGFRSGAIKAGPVVGAGVATGAAIAIVRRLGRARSDDANGPARATNGGARGANGRVGGSNGSESVVNGRARVTKGHDSVIAIDDDPSADPPRQRRGGRGGRGAGGGGRGGGGAGGGGGGGAGIMTLGVLIASVAAYAIRRRARHARTTVAANGNPGGSTESASAGPVPNNASPDRPSNAQVPQHTDEMRDIGDVLTAQHRHLDNLFAKVQSADNPVTKRETFASLVDFINRHERAEQEIVHPVLRDIGPEGVDMWTRRMNEEEVADRALASLIAQDVAHPNFTSGLAKLRSMVRAHAQHEEDEEFPLLRARVPGSKLRRMATRIRVAQVDYW